MGGRVMAFGGLTDDDELLIVKLKEDNKKLQKRLIHIGGKLNAVLGLNDQEIEWMRECGVIILEKGEKDE